VAVSSNRQLTMVVDQQQSTAVLIRVSRWSHTFSHDRVCGSFALLS